VKVNKEVDRIEEQVSESRPEPGVFPLSPKWLPGAFVSAEQSW